MKKYISYSTALQKLQRYCAYQERCHSEVRSKLLDLGIYGDDLESIISDLIENNYLNELRFAQVFVGGKFRIKQWGRQKIMLALKQKRISAYCIKKAFQTEILEKEYRNTLIKVLAKKDRLLVAPNPYVRKQKLATYAQQRGFESPLIWSLLNTVDTEFNWDLLFD